ncbi:Retrovirus-related Pol polyprotein from transposon 297 [Vitis vinifera]|uniref:Retrovirus-related Pol polyprotein from transposon 297 n=1 Tax=Vitis vinifera TaxID=29760 RepID=A0A438CMF6_VITVI|nr:Retrovirus-related Pol polyprotein from transposon 297 [Vitis vinifera]
MMTADRATCIVFSDDLPPEGLDHVCPLYITVGCSGLRVPSVLLDNGSTLNVCPLATAIALGFAPSDFGPSTQTVRAYDSTKKEVMGRPRIHKAGAIPYSLYQKVKFIHDGHVIIVQSTRDMLASSEPVLQISYSEDDLFLIGFIFYKIQTLEIEDFCRDFVAMSFDQHNSTVVLDMMREEVTNDGMVVDPIEMIDGVVPYDEYQDEMDMMAMSHITSIVQFQPISPFDMFGVFTIEVVEETQTILAQELLEGDGSLFEGTVSPIEEVSNLVDPPLSFDVLLGFVSLFDDVSIASFMDLSIFEYLPVSCDNERVSSTTGNVGTIDFGTEDQPRELKIGSPLSTDERDRLIHLLRSIKQKLRRLHSRWSLQVKKEIKKQLSVGFISVVEYLEWLANIVPVPRKDGKVRVSVDFRDLNKASPKDDFPFPHIDLLLDNTVGHSMLSFMDGFSGYNQILMAPEDMEKTTFITEWGTYCYRVMPFGTDHLEAIERFFERIRKFRLKLNPKKCTFGVTSGKLLGHMVSERGIKVDLDKIKAILDMPVPRTEKEIRGFLGRLQYISRFIARLIDILPPTSGRPLLLYLSVSDMTLGCMLAQLDDSGKDQAIYYMSKRMLEYEMGYVMIERYCLTLVWAIRRLRHYMTKYSYASQKAIKESIVVDHLASLPTFEDKPIDDDFPDEEFVAMTSLLGWCMYFDGATNQSGYEIVEYEACILGLETALELGIRQMEIFGDSNLVLRHIRGDWKTRDNRFADVLTTLAYFVDIPIDVVVCQLLIELRSAPAYCCLIGETEVQDDLPWYHDIYQFLRSRTYPEVAIAKDRRALRQLTTRFVICGDTLYRRSIDGMLILCLDRASADCMMRKVHVRVCGSHMEGHMLA